MHGLMLWSHVRKLNIMSHFYNNSKKKQKQNSNTPLAHVNAWGGVQTVSNDLFIAKLNRQHVA